MTRSTSCSSYISDDDLLMPEVAAEPSSDFTPSYHSSEATYKQRKAAQEQLRKQAFAKSKITQQQVKRPKKEKSSSPSPKTKS